MQPLTPAQCEHIAARLDDLAAEVSGLARRVDALTPLPVPAQRPAPSAA